MNIKKVKLIRRVIDTKFKSDIITESKIEEVAELIRKFTERD
jgi:hypothetical protein